MYFFYDVADFSFLCSPTLLFLIEDFFLLVFVLLVFDFIDIILYQLGCQWFFAIDDIKNESFVIIFLMNDDLSIERVIAT